MLTVGVIATTITLLTELVPGIGVVGVEVAIDDEAAVNWDEEFVLNRRSNRYHNNAAHWTGNWNSRARR